MATTLPTPPTILDSATALMIVPPPIGLPEKIGQAYSKAMGEVAHLLDDPEVHRRFAHLLLTELRIKPALQSCSPASLVTAIVEMAEENLDPSGINECFLVPYQGEVKMQRGYAGLVKLAGSHPEVLDIFADEVCVNDVYEFYGVNMRPKHIYPGAFQPRGRYIGYYAVAQLTHGRWRAVQMSVDEMKAHAVHYSQNATKKVWSEDRGGGFRGMSLKTVLRKLCNPKYIPMSARVYEKLRQQDIVEGLIVDSSLGEEREPLSAREWAKTIPAHIADLCGDDPRGSTVRCIPIVNAETGEVVGTDRIQEDAQILSHRLAVLQERLGWTTEQKKAWENKQARRFRKTYTDLPPETIAALLIELEAGHSLESGTITQDTTQEAPSAAQERQSPSQPTQSTQDASPRQTEGKNSHAASSAWRDTLEAHKAHPALPEALGAKVRLALNPKSETTDTQGLALASAVLDILDNLPEPEGK